MTEEITIRQTGTEATTAVPSGQQGQHKWRARWR